jgi:hypothetical protein
MTNRVLLNASGLKVSKPGVNVLTAPTSGLQFSSDWSALGFYRSAEIDCNWNRPEYLNFSLGKTFSTPPMVQFHRVISSSQTELMSALNGFYWAFENNYEDLDGNMVYNYHRVEATVTTTQIRIKSGRAGTNPTFRLRYTILDYGL